MIPAGRRYMDGVDVLRLCLINVKVGEHSEISFQRRTAFEGRPAASGRAEKKGVDGAKKRVRSP